MDISIPVVDVAIICMYLVGIMAIGIWFGYKKGASTTQFFLAGRGQRWSIIGPALFCANISTIHLVGLAADGYRVGLAVGNFEWMASFCLIILGLGFAPFYFRSKLSTLPEYLERRYCPSARTILAFIFLMSALLVHIGISLYAGAKVLEDFFGLNLFVSLVAIAGVTAVYTIVGGLKAVMVSDAVQAVILIAGAVILTVMGINALPAAGVETLAQFKEAVKPEQANMLQSVRNPQGIMNDYSWICMVFGYPVLGIWYWCTDQTIVQKVLSAKTEKDGQDGAIFAGYLKILPVFIMVFPGVLAYVLFKDQIGGDNNSTLMVMIRNLLPKGIKGLFAAGLLAALMSTVAAALNSTATLMATDIVQRLRPKTKDRSLVWIGRITAAVVILLAMAWSTQGDKFESIFVAINKIPMAFAPAITCIFVLGVFWRRGTKQAAMTVLIFNIAVGIVYLLIDIPLIGSEQVITNLGLPFMLVGAILCGICFVIYVIVSLMTPAPAPEQLENLCWEHPLQALRKGAIKGVTDPRIMAGALLVLMIILYILMG